MTTTLLTAMAVVPTAPWNQELDGLALAHRLCANVQFPCRNFVTIALRRAVAVCGNGVIEGTEVCDDNNTANGDGCRSDCTVESGAGWTCSVASPSVCQCQCTVFLSSSSMSHGTMAVCGNGVIEGTETCDDNNTASDDGCNSTCDTENGAGWTCAGVPSICQRTPVSLTDGNAR